MDGYYKSKNLTYFWVSAKIGLVINVFVFCRSIYGIIIVFKLLLCIDF